MNNRITYIGLYAFSLYSLIMSLICGIIVLLLVMLCRTLFLYSQEMNYYRLIGPLYIIYRGLFLGFLIFKSSNGIKLTVKEKEYLNDKDQIENPRGGDTSLLSTYKLIMFYLNHVAVYYQFWQLMLFLQNKKEKVMYTSNTIIEVCWTILPIIVLIIIMLPSLVLLYAMDDVSIAFGNVTIKVIGHQWYWSYQHVNMSAELMPVFYDINKLAYIDSKWLSSLERL